MSNLVQGRIADLWFLSSSGIHAGLEVGRYETVPYRDFHVLAGYKAYTATCPGEKFVPVCFLHSAAVTGSGPLTFFLDMVELSVADAKTIKAVFLTCLTSHGIDETFLKKHFIYALQRTYGTSTMLSNKSGVATLLLTLSQSCCVAHYCNHSYIDWSWQLEIQSRKLLGHFQSFIDKLYPTYRMPHQRTSVNLYIVRSSMQWKANYWQLGELLTCAG